MATCKAEFLSHYYSWRLRPRHAYAFGLIAAMEVLEPSCAAVFRDELRNLFPRDENAYRLQQQTFLLSEFLEQR